MGFPGSSDSKESVCTVGDLGLTPGIGRSRGEGNDYPLQYSGLENLQAGWNQTNQAPLSMWTQRLGHN